MKMVLIDEERKVHAQVTEEDCNQKPMSGFNEIDPEPWVESMERGIKKILAPLEKKDFCSAPPEGSYYEPDPDAAAACEEKYQKFLRLHRGLKYIATGEET